MGYLSRKAEGLEPYVPGEQPGEGAYVKLNTNENPYPPSPSVTDVIKREAGPKLRLYPDPTCSILTETAAKMNGLSRDMVFAGNGSDEILAFAFAAFFSGKKIVFPAVTYSFYPVYCKMFDVEYEEVPMKPGLLVDYESMKNSGCGVVFPNPNAPTGQMCSVDFIRGMAEENKDSVILVDEAYVDFGGESSIGLVKEFENLMVVQTMSKSKSLAGMRIGLAFADSGLIEGLERVRDSFNSYTVGRLAQHAGAAALEDTEYYDGIRSKIMRTRQETFEKLEGLGFSCMDSKANFIFATHRTTGAKTIYEKLKKEKVLVRYFDKPGIDNHVRITIGTDGQMARLLECLEKIIGD